MSRIGKVPVAIPSGVKINVANNTVQVEGPKGKLSLAIPAGISVEQKDGKVVVTRANDQKQTKANHGTIKIHIVNMIEGVTKGHKKELEVQGVGFRVAVQGAKLVMNLGFSHPIEFEIPKEVKVTAAKPTEIVIEGTDKAMVGQVAANIRDYKRPEPYKGKGIRYVGEVVRRKQGKSVTK